MARSYLSCGHAPVSPIGRRFWHSNFIKAMRAGSVGVLNVAATGAIVGVVTLTGLGLKFSSIVIDLAGGSLLLTAIHTALVSGSSAWRCRSRPRTSSAP